MCEWCAFDVPPFQEEGEDTKRIPRLLPFLLLFIRFSFPLFSFFFLFFPHSFFLLFFLVIYFLLRPFFLFRLLLLLSPIGSPPSFSSSLSSSSHSLSFSPSTSSPSLLFFPLSPFYLLPLFLSPSSSRPSPSSSASPTSLFLHISPHPSSTSSTSAFYNYPRRNYRNPRDNISQRLKDELFIGKRNTALALRVTYDSGEGRGHRMKS